MAHKGEVRASLQDFGKDESIAFRRTEPAFSGYTKPKEGAYNHVGQAEIEYQHAGEIKVLSQNSGVQLYAHQEKAVAQLDKRIGKATGDFAGLLVLPTGGGKTLTAAYWLAKNLLDKGKKVLWIAHRHELLTQAKDTFHERLAFQDIFRERKKFSYRIISGVHDKPVSIKATDDLLIASKDSLNAGFDYLHRQWLHDTDEVFLVIDEAHHATAHTYRQLIENLKKTVRRVRVLGLTATPFRTVEDEQGLLARVFPDDIIYKENLLTLIGLGILSDPEFEEANTEFDAVQLLTEEQIAAIGSFDITSIGEATAKKIAENQERNWCIVNRYLQHRARYGQTLVFALNQDNAIALKKLFEEQKVRCAFVLSSIRDQGTGAGNSGKVNQENIRRFRAKELDVLINVNILTEGTDLPNVQTVFLARPTISPTLMTQMIGRGLRGEKAGGTAKAYIVSFVDNWQDKVAWVNPEKLLIEANTDFNDERQETQKQLVKLISISKIEEFALLTNNTMDQAARDRIEQLTFLERVPLGIYHFVLLSSNGEEAREKNCEILVYSNIEPAYTEFMGALPDFFAQHEVGTKGYLTDEQLATLGAAVEADFFAGHETQIGYAQQDVKDVLQYYHQHKKAPTFVALQDRSRFDIGTVAQHLWTSNLTLPETAAYKNQLWNDNQAEWQVFFGRDEKSFLREIDLAISRLSNPELFAEPNVVPTEIKELRRLERLSMSEIQEVNPSYWLWLREQVYAKYQDAEGFYCSAESGRKSKEKYHFQIDHIKPISKGGLTELDNLQLLLRAENARKGAKT